MAIESLSQYLTQDRHFLTRSKCHMTFHGALSLQNFVSNNYEWLGENTGKLNKKIQRQIQHGFNTKSALHDSSQSCTAKELTSQSIESHSSVNIRRISARPNAGDAHGSTTERLIDAIPLR